MIVNVCTILFKHIEAAERFIIHPTEGALLFHERNFTLHEWEVQTTSGYSSTMPLFLYVLEEIELVIKPATLPELIAFMKRIFDKM